MKSLELVRTLPPLPLRLAALVLCLTFGASLLGATDARSQEPAQDPVQEPGGSLADDASVGRIVDREGSAARRAVMADRWGPANARARIEPGDWFKTGSRGANALSLELGNGAKIVLGPAGLIEVPEGDKVVLLRGELGVNVPQGQVLEVAGPGASTIEVRGQAVLRAAKGALTRLPDKPRWLAGYEGNASTEALGSLLANVDGRNVPLTIGYHKVTVDIRDQIARTVIEESFVNHTTSVLEGVFYFPLPADASISGFAMWIGGEQVPGEIIEKQRAREIYETILREKRDPGLLEWSGGNLFKARIYPIGAEKRIKISYTQVLPKTGDEFAYHYGLSSELLRKNPLRELQIEVTVSSAETLKQVTCPSHDCRIRTTDHSARIEFEAEEFAPEGDFELRFQVAESAGDLVATAHRRGDDGYFMMFVNAPPVPDGGNVAGATAPIDLLVLADTSGSMFGPARDAQVAFIEALLGTLGEGDTFNLATCDTRTRWAFDRSTGNSDDARENALRFLEARAPLGWSDLDAAFAMAFAAARPNTHVVYVGDGIPTSGAADPVAFAQSLTRSYDGTGTFHAVVPGNRSELVVLRAIAALGGGSVRSIGGGTDPATTAFRLVREIASPSMKDLTLAFEGIEVAAVYPERLPNLPAGAQQIIVGRFDPSSGATSGKVVLTGTFDGKPVRTTAEIVLAEDDEGNSFIPRLWARRHLDHLLDQGRSPEIKQRIIALSEDFQIITPYTSFLVLESDADRERFQVQKAFRMRDGEEFFTDGRDSARHELLREQMKRAKGWRRRLRAEALVALAKMNRELTELLRPSGPFPLQGNTVALGIAWSAELSNMGVSGGYRGPGDSARLRELGYAGEGIENEEFEDAGDGWSEERDEIDAAMEPSSVEERLDFDAPASSPVVDGLRAMKSMGRVSRQAGRPMGSSRSKRGFLGRFELSQRFQGGASGPTAPYYAYNGFLGDAFAQLFPTIGGPRADAPALTWSEDVNALARSLDRRTTIAALEGGVSIAVETTYTDVRGRSRKSASEHVVGADRWVVRGAHVAGNVYPIDWYTGEERGVVNVGWWLGRTRDAEDGDASAWAAPFSWSFGDSIRSYADYTAKVEETEDGNVRLTLVHPRNTTSVMTLTIDRERAVVLEQSWSVKGEMTLRTTFGGFQNVAGAWWPSTIEHWNQNPASGTTRTAIAVESLSEVGLGERTAAAVENRGQWIVLGEEPSDVAAAKQAVKDETAGLDEHFHLLRHFASSQRWERASVHLAAIVEECANKPGLAPIRMTYLQSSGRNEELRQLLLTVAADLAARPRDGEYGLATHTLGFTLRIGAGSEQLAFLDTIRPVIDRQSGMIDAALPWDRWVLQALQGMGRTGDALAKLEAMAVEYPLEAYLHVQYANQLASAGEVDRALAVLDTVLVHGAPWQAHEISQFLAAGSQILWNSYRLEAFVKRIEGWEREAPERIDSNLASQYLSALILLDREDQAWTLIEAWLTDYRRAELEAFERARLQAAVQHALGQGYNLYSYRYEDDRAVLLADAARGLARLEEDHGLVHQIVSHYRFRDTDPARALIIELFAELESGTRELSPRRLSRLVTWVRSTSYMPEEGADEGAPAWERIVESIFARWLKTDDPGDRQVLGQIVLAQGGTELHARYYRRMIELAPDEAQRIAAVQSLSSTLMQLPWTQERESELVILLGALTIDAEDGSTEAEANMDVRILALYDLTGWLPRARANAEIAGLEGVNEMPRRKLAARRAEALRSGRAATSELLSSMETPADLAHWVSIERVFLDLKNKARLSAARTASIELLALLARRHAETVDADIPLRDRVLAARSAATHAFLLSRYAEADRVKHLPAFDTLVDENIATDAELIDWKDVKYTLLLALDRPDEIEALLTTWYGGGDQYAKIRWGRDLAYVVSERSQLDHAVAILVEIERIDELTHEDYRVLSDLYTVLDRPDDAREAKISSWQVVGEYTNGNALSNEAYAVQRSHRDGVPSDLDPEVPLRLVALMRKASEPSSWIRVLQRYYEPTKDYRLLECIPEAVMGRSAQQIYPFLRSLRPLMGMIQEEATVDRMRAHLVALHEDAKTDVDRRALRLLEFMLVQNATRQANGTESHARIAQQALAETIQGAWSDGEPRLMAEFLAAVGTLEPEALAEEQLRLLRLLRGKTDDADDRLAIASSHASVLWGYGQHDVAIQTLEGAIALYRGSAERALPSHMNGNISTLCSWYESVGSYAKAEAFWIAEAERSDTVQQTLWLHQSLFGSYRNAVLAKASVSLGEGEALYRAVHTRLMSALDERTNESHTQQLVYIATDLWTRAHKDLDYGGPADDVTLFAFRGLPRVLAMYQYRGGQNVVSSLVECLLTVRGMETTLEFLVVRAETEPAWLRLQNQDFWSQHSWRFANLRRRIGKLPVALEVRVLAIVLEEIGEDLRTRQSRSRSIYDIRNSDFWSEKSEDFKAVAIRFVKSHDDSAAAVVYATDYLFNGLHAHDEAIDALDRAYDRDLLDIGGRFQLASFLQRRQRWAESIPVLAALIEEHPERVDFHVMVMHGYFGVKAKGELTTAHAAAESWFRENDQWNESVIAALAQGCLDTELFEHAAAHFDEAIALHVKSAPNRGVGDGVLSRYYRSLSGVYSGLGRTDEAVDAAAGAIVSWGGSIAQRQEELRQLRRILAVAKDLDAYVARLDAETEASGLENPILRQALGRVFLDKKRWKDAARELRRALDAQPNDFETYPLLVRAYEGLGDNERAAQTVLEWARVREVELTLFSDLGQRLALLEKDDEAERAWTQLVEAMPNESESHAALAEVRQGQNRWDAASAHWRHVIRIRTNEPTGYENLARALMRQEKWDEATTVIEQLIAWEWPERFGNVHARARGLLREGRW